MEEKIRLELKDKDDNIIQFVEGEVSKEMADELLARFIEVASKD